MRAKELASQKEVKMHEIDTQKEVKLRIREGGHGSRAQV
jgi:hypothetical protein